jgi:hypothetical protein
MATAKILRRNGSVIKEFSFNPNKLTPFKLFKLVNENEGKRWNEIEIRLIDTLQCDCKITNDGCLIDSKVLSLDDQLLMERIAKRFDELHEMTMQRVV